VHLRQALDQMNGRWGRTGFTGDARPVRIIVAIEDNAVVVTTWDPSAKEDTP
jgi:hypothetical protein